MRLFTTSRCHVTKIGNKTANINAKNIRHNYTSKTAEIKNGDKTFAAVDIFRRYAAIVLSPFFIFAVFDV